MLKDIIKQLAKAFPTFVVLKSTDRELGRRLVAMGYEHKRLTKGSAFKIEELFYYRSERLLILKRWFLIQ